MIDEVDRPVSPAVIADLTEFMTLLGNGELSARLPVADLTGPDRALLTAGNVLAERLEALRQRYRESIDRQTAELRQLNDDVLRLSEFGNLLQACEHSEEAYQVIEHEVDLLFPGLAGALYLFNASRNMLELKAVWGGLDSEPALPREYCWALRRGRQHLVLASSPRLSCRHTLERWGDSICYPMSAQGETLGMLHLMGRSLQQPGQRLLTAGKQQLGITMAEQTALSLANLRMRDSLGQQALRDPLTGLYNRRFVDEWVGREVGRAERRGAPLGFLMADIDHFKRFNDVHGHDAGDAILGAVAAAIRNHVREDDIACRYGGEELLILLADAERSSLLARAEELRAAVASTTVLHNGHNLPPVTISIGVGLFPEHGERPADVIRIADSALYLAKHQGRNRVVIAAADTPSQTPHLSISA